MLDDASKGLGSLLRGATSPIAALMALAGFFSWNLDCLLDADISEITRVWICGAYIVFTFAAFVFIAVAACKFPKELTYDKDAHIRTRQLDADNTFSGLDLDEPWDTDGPIETEDKRLSNELGKA